MKMETPEQTIQYLQGDVAKLNQEISRLKTLLELNLEKYGTNIKYLAQKIGVELLHKRPCDKCNGMGCIPEPVPPKDPRASVDCTGGVQAGPPSKPCMDCKTKGFVWKTL